MTKVPIIFLGTGNIGGTLLKQILDSGEEVVHASLLIAGIPTFMIFVFCQKIIMRGIVVPSEK